MRTPLRAALSAVLLMGTIVGTASCAADAPSASATGATVTSSPRPAAPSPAPARPVYVAVGASETVGVGATRPAAEAWPRVLHERALAGTAYVNVGVSGSTVRQALLQQLPRALAERPRVATVWLNVNDLLSGVAPQAYEADLRQLVHALRRDGGTTVLVANTPRVDALPSYLACLPDPPAAAPACARPGLTPPPPVVVRAAVAEYNAAIARVVKAEGAVLVDLHAAATARSGARLTSADGFHPSTAGHRAVAAAFTTALTMTLRRSGSGA